MQQYYSLGRQSDRLIVQIKRDEDFDLSVLSPNGSDLFLECASQSSAEHTIEYQTENWICLKEFLEQIQLDQLESSRFLFDLFSALAAGCRNQPVILELEAILVSFKGDRIALLRAPLILERWMKRSEEIDQFLIALMEKLPCPDYEIFGLLWKEHVRRASFQESAKAIADFYRSKSRKRWFSRKNQMEPFCLKHPVFPGSQPAAKPESFLGLRRQKEMQKTAFNSNEAAGLNQPDGSWRNQYLQQMEDLPVGQTVFLDSDFGDGLSFPDALASQPFGEDLLEAKKEAGFSKDALNLFDPLPNSLGQEQRFEPQQSTGSLSDRFESQPTACGLKEDADKKEEPGIDQIEDDDSRWKPIEKSPEQSLASEEMNPFENWQMPQGIQEQMSEARLPNQNVSFKRQSPQPESSLYGNRDWKQPLYTQNQPCLQPAGSSTDDFYAPNPNAHPAKPPGRPEQVQSKREIQIQRKTNQAAGSLATPETNQSEWTRRSENSNLSAGISSNQPNPQARRSDNPSLNSQGMNSSHSKPDSARQYPSGLEPKLPKPVLDEDESHTVLMDTLFEPCYLEINEMKYALQGLEMVVGRALDCQIRIHDRSVSSHHAKLLQVDGRWYIQDLKSTNSTWLAGKKVIRRMRLKDGMIVRFGQVQAVFHQ